MTSDQFRNDPDLRTKAEKVLHDPVLSQMMEIVRRETPTRINGRELIKAEVQAHILLGASYGYEMALDSLQRLATVVPESPKPVGEVTHPGDPDYPQLKPDDF